MRRGEQRIFTRRESIVRPRTNSATIVSRTRHGRGDLGGARGSTARLALGPDHPEARDRAHERRGRRRDAPRREDLEELGRGGVRRFAEDLYQHALVRRIENATAPGASSRQVEHVSIETVHLAELFDRPRTCARGRARFDTAHSLAMDRIGQDLPCNGAPREAERGGHGLERAARGEEPERGCSEACHRLGFARSWRVVNRRGDAIVGGARSSS